MTLQKLPRTWDPCLRVYVSFDVAEGGLRLLVDGIAEGLDNVIFEVGRARILRDNRVSKLAGVLRIIKVLFLSRTSCSP